MGLSETFIRNQVRADEQVAVALHLSGCSVFTKVLPPFYHAKTNTTEKMSQRDFIVILSCESYFVIS